MTSVGGWLEKADASRRGWRLRRATVIDEAMKKTGVGVVGLVGPALILLLLACANVANLLLARNVSRARELAIRAALGASRSRLLGERLAEGVWLGLAGAACGVLMGYWGVESARTWIVRMRDPLLGQNIRLDMSGLIFALTVGVATPLLFGLIPAAISSSGASLSVGLRIGSTFARGQRKKGLSGGELLAVLGMGLAVILVVTSALFMGLLVDVSHLERGFDSARLLSVKLAFRTMPMRNR